MPSMLFVNVHFNKSFWDLYSQNILQIFPSATMPRKLKTICIYRDQKSFSPVKDTWKSHSSFIAAPMREIWKQLKHTSHSFCFCFLKRLLVALRTSSSDNMWDLITTKATTNTEILWALSSLAIHHLSWATISSKYCHFGC